MALDSVEALVYCVVYPVKIEYSPFLRVIQDAPVLRLL
jgi:hypothetical protein